MIGANITIPRSVICGTCNILISLFKPIKALKRTNIVLDGDMDGVAYELAGIENTWTLQLTFPQEKAGQLSVGLIGEVIPNDSDDPIAIEQVTVVIDYDTFHIITAEWGEPVYENRVITLPINFLQKVIGLTKDCFGVYMDGKYVRYELFGTGNELTYYLRFYPPRSATGTIRVSLLYSVMKYNFIKLKSDIQDIEIQVS